MDWVAGLRVDIFLCEVLYDKLGDYRPTIRNSPQIDLLEAWCDCRAQHTKRTYCHDGRANSDGHQGASRETAQKLVSETWPGSVTTSAKAQPLPWPVCDYIIGGRAGSTVLTAGVFCVLLILSLPCGVITTFQFAWARFYSR